MRAFKRDEVPQEVIEKVIDLARWAPSGANRQPWHFIVVRDPETKKKLSSAAKAAFLEINRHVYEAPVVIVSCSDSRASRWHRYDTTNATMCLLLAAEYYGLATCWVGLFREGKVKEIPKIPAETEVIALIPMGYAAEKPSAPPRLSVEEITFYDRWGNKSARSRAKIDLFKRGMPSLFGKAVKNAIRVAYRQFIEVIRGT